MQRHLSARKSTNMFHLMQQASVRTLTRAKFLRGSPCCDTAGRKPYLVFRVGCREWASSIGSPPWVRTALTSDAASAW